MSPKHKHYPLMLYILITPFFFMSCKVEEPVKNQFIAYAQSENQIKKSTDFKKEKPQQKLKYHLTTGPHQIFVQDLNDLSIHIDKINKLIQRDVYGSIVRIPKKHTIKNAENGNYYIIVNGYKKDKKAIAFRKKLMIKEYQDGYLVSLAPNSTSQICTSVTCPEVGFTLTGDCECKKIVSTK